MAHILKRMGKQFATNNAICKFQWTNLKHYIAVSEADQNKNSESFLPDIKTVSSAKEIFRFIDKQANTLTHKQLLQAMKALFNLHRAGRLVLKENIMHNPTFEMLCHNLKNHARTLEASEAIEAIKFLTHFKVPPDSLIVQSMLQIIRKKINDLNLSQIIFLDFLFSKMDSQNHLIDALKLALPLVFQIHLPLEQDNDDIQLLGKSLNYSCSNQMPDKYINNIVTGLILNDQKLDVTIAKSAVWSLCQVDCSEKVYPTRTQLLHICFNVLVKHIDELSTEMIIKTANVLKTRVIDKDMVFYSESLMDAMANSLISRNASFQECIDLARTLSRIGHTHIQLIEYLCQKAVSDHNTLENCSIHSLFAFVSCLAYSNFTPEAQTWREIKRQISLNPLGSDNPNFPWTKMCLEMISLKIYDDRVLQKTFSEDYITEYVERLNKEMDYINLLSIHEAVRLFYNKKYSLSDRVLSKAKELVSLHRVTGIIAEHVAMGLGDEKCVAKDVSLPNGMIADVLICIKDGHPVQLIDYATDTKTSFESLKIPSKSYIVCIQNFGPSCFSINSNRLRGTIRLIQDILERQGYIVVGVNRDQWLKVTPHERTPYLMREISYKCAEMGVNLNIT